MKPTEIQTPTKKESSKLNQIDKGSEENIESLDFKIQPVIITMTNGNNNKEHFEKGHLFLSAVSGIIIKYLFVNNDKKINLYNSDL